MGKRRLLIYSDCFTYSGSENVIENILKSSEINAKYEIVFYFAQNINYQAGVKRKLPEYKNIFPFKTISSYNQFGYSLEVNRNSGNSSSLSIKLKYAALVFFEKTGLVHLINAARLFNLFNGENPDILYINNGGYPGAASCRVAVLSASLAGVKNVLFNVNNMAFPAKHFLAKTADRFINKQVRYFITASKAAGKALRTLRGFDKTKLVDIPNTLPKSAEFEIKSIQGKLKREFFLKNDVVILGAVGLLTNRKGFHILIEAIGLVKRSAGVNMPFKLFIFGDGEERAKLEEKVLLKGLQDNIFLPGFRLGWQQPDFWQRH